MTKKEAWKILQQDAPTDARTLEAFSLALDALALSMRLPDDIDAKCAYCKAPMYVVVRGHHHTELINGIEQDVTK